jgi:hypothetical protein
LDGALPSRWLDAAQSFVAGDPRRAADIYAAIGSRPDEAYAHLEAARQLTVVGNAVEANTELAIAFALYREAGASAHLVSRIVDSLLFSGAAQPSDLEIHLYEYEVNQ